MHLFLKIPWVIFEEPSNFRINGFWEETTTQGLQSGHFLISCHIINMICSSKLYGMSKIFKIGRDLKDPNSVCLFNLCGNRSRYNIICLKFSVFFWPGNEHLFQFCFSSSIGHAETSLNKPVSHAWKVWN